MGWSDLFTALGLAAVIEGAAYALAPEATKRAFNEFFSMPVEARRLVGLIVCVGGLLLVLLARS